MRMHPPNRVELPSGRVVALRAREGVGRRARRRAGPLFSEMIDLVTSGDLVLSERGRAVDVRALELRDFHALRAIATRIGWLDEDPIEIACHNCDGAIRRAPCAALELGPFVDGELDDPDLDRTLDLSSSHAIPAVALGPDRVAHEIALTQVTVATATPLHRALNRRRLRVSERIVVAMGIASLGPEHDPRHIADALAHCSEQAWHAIGDLFLEAHYPPRLSAIVLCPNCGARSDVDAPYEREFEPTVSALPSNAQIFPEFDAFAAHARALFQVSTQKEAPGVALFVDAGVPACDDGGEPLLGAYVPPGGDPSAPMGLAEISLYFRSFRAMWNEEGPYDWEAEVEETIEHELGHHAGWRVGHDSADDEERAEIGRERAVVVGRKATVRAALAAMGVDVGGFIARTWPIWLIVAVWTIAISVCGASEPR
jgi:hypothetical protein